VVPFVSDLPESAWHYRGRGSLGIPSLEPGLGETFLKVILHCNVSQQKRRWILERDKNSNVAHSGKVFVARIVRRAFLLTAVAVVFSVSSLL